MLAAGILALAAAIADTARLFIRSGDRSLPALVAWALWTAALAGPLVLAVRERRRRAPAAPRETAWTYLVLGYGMAIFALHVMDASR
jgi:hypothetical protein